MYIFYECTDSREWIEVETLQEAEEFLISIAYKLLSFEVYNCDICCGGDIPVEFDEELTKERIYFLLREFKNGYIAS